MPSDAHALHTSASIDDDDDVTTDKRRTPRCAVFSPHMQRRRETSGSPRRFKHRRRISPPFLSFSRPETEVRHESHKTRQTTHRHSF